MTVKSFCVALNPPTGVCQSRDVSFKNHSTRGFTLIEILVVLFIISIVSTVALLSISRNQTKQLQNFTTQLSQQITLAEEEALLQSTVIGLSIDEKQAQFFSYQAATDKDKKDTWVPIQDTVLAKQIIPGNMQVKVVIANAKKSDEEEISADENRDEEKTITPQIIISTNGDITPFTIYVGKRDDKPRFAIIGTADGSVTVKEQQ